MSKVEKSITVSVPVRVAYNQWTRFDEYPRFMDGVKSVRQLDDRHLEWHAQIDGKDDTWTADIMEQIPDQRIAWRGAGGARNDGVVSFHRLDDNTTRVVLQLEYDSRGPAENVGSALAMVERRVEGDLKRFKEFIEVRQAETGAMHGEMRGSQVKNPAGVGSISIGQSGMGPGSGSTGTGQRGKSPVSAGQEGTGRPTKTKASKR